MTAVLLSPLFEQFNDANGAPLNGGLIYSYQAGTTTPKDTYTDATGTTPAANPIVLDSAGRPPSGGVWGSGTYKFILKDSLGNTIGTIDNVTAIYGSGDMTKAVYDPANISQQVVGTTAVQTVSNKTFSTGCSGTFFKSVATQVFTASGTYTPNANMSYCRVRMVAAGGGSGGINGSTLVATGCGGPGEYAEGWFSASDIGVPKAVTVGTGGTAGANTGTNGGTGNNSSLGSLLTAVGGSGSNGSTTGSTITNPASGGTGGTGGSLHIQSPTGQFGFYVSGAFAFGSNSPCTPLGKYGAGGLGVASLTASAKAGTAGNDGIVIIEEYLTA